MSELEHGVSRKLCGFIVEGRLAARHGYELYADGAKIGYVTSGSISPVLNKNIGLGYVEKKYSEPGSRIQVKVRNDLINADIVKIPFVAKN
jgi:aminomethyltransferase